MTPEGFMLLKVIHYSNFECIKASRLQIRPKETLKAAPFKTCVSISHICTCGGKEDARAAASRFSFLRLAVWVLWSTTLLLYSPLVYQLRKQMFSVKTL